ncbi:cytochrome P450 81C13-like isoform X2 [Quercus lobata]|uniref:cytochrome P450 81C13-like isoform X2 n=1 Tax=Quercus lobata TaxID=97700 RepID=UPI0012458336|nr:cytochrome P450 81C13-like isoform X2 [Quercus lobata]
MESLYFYLALILSTVFIIKLLNRHRNKNLPPSPFSLPIIGHLHLLKQPLHKTLETLSLQYGPILSLKFGSRSILVVSSPSAVEECFTKNDIIFANRPQTMAGDRLTYNCTAPVWAPYGHLWRNLRRVSTIEIFSHISLQKSSTIREEVVYSLLRQLFKVSNIEPQKVDFKYLSTLLVSNIMMRIVAGKPCVGEEFTCMDVGKKLLKEFKEVYFASLAVNICDFFPILRWVGYKGLEENMIRLHRKRDEALGRLIEEISRLNNDNIIDVEKKRTLIETLFSLRKSDPEFFSDDVIKSLTLMMLIAGTDTTATTIEWAMSLLLNHPEVLQKVKAEIDNQVGADCTVGGFHIPQGTILLVNAWSMHRDPKFWEEPTKFKPERFEEINGEREGFKFIPFGIGRRVCPGAGMAMRVTSLALGSLIQCFDWKRVGKEMVDMTSGFGFLMPKTQPLEAVCTPCPSMTNILSQL